MTTDELIKALRDLADECEDRKLIILFDEAADQLEKLDERVSIKEADEPHANEQSEGEQLTF